LVFSGVISRRDSGNLESASADGGHEESPDQRMDLRSALRAGSEQLRESAGYANTEMAWMPEQTDERS
jgi:hypothetical protein